MPASTLLLSHPGVPLGERLAERWGGMGVALAFAVMALALAWRAEWIGPPPAPEPPREIIRVQFAPQEPPPPPTPMEVSAASATRPNPEADMALEQAPPAPETATDPGAPAPEAAAAPAPSEAASGVAEPATAPAGPLQRAPVEKRELSEAQRRVLEADRRDVAEQAQALEQRRQQLALESEKRWMESRARQLSFASAGAQDGVVRRLDLRGVPEDVLQRVMDRNGIDIVTMNLDGNVAAASPIGSVATDTGDFHQRDRIEPGYYEVFRMSSATFAKIARLEAEYMRQHRLDPEKTQWIGVTYGVRHVGGTVGYDLVIVDANYRRLE